MSHAVKKSNAPLFTAYGADPNYHEMQSVVMNKDDMLDYANHENKWSAGKFEDGEIICEVVPIGFFYKDADGNIVQEDVKPDALTDMLLLQSDIYEGNAEHVPTEKYEKKKDKQNELFAKYDMMEKGAQYFADDDGALTKYDVEEALVKAKNYSPSDIYFDGNTCVVDTGYEVFTVSPCGKHCGLPVYDPYDVDAVPFYGW